MKVYVTCVRDPDASNEFKVWYHSAVDVEVEIVDVDLGRSDLDNAVEFAEWAWNQWARAQDIRKDDVYVAMWLERFIIEQFEQRSHFNHINTGVFVAALDMPEEDAVIELFKGQ